MWVASRTTSGALPASRASFHRSTHKHHWSPGLSPGNSYCGTGVDKSLPRLRENFKKSSVIRAQTKCIPWSSTPVRQQPSRKKPVIGSKEHGCNSVPNTLLAPAIGLAPPRLLSHWSTLASVDARVSSITGSPRTESVRGERNRVILIPDSGGPRQCARRLGTPETQ